MSEDETLEMLEQWVNAYPLDIFQEMTEEDRAHSGTITRASAAMGRHMIEMAIKPAVAAIHDLQRQRAEAVAAERERCARICEAIPETDPAIYAYNRHAAIGLTKMLCAAAVRQEPAPDEGAG